MGNAERSSDKSVRIRTFMPVLEACLASYPVANVLEFGMGMASTWYLLGVPSIQKLVSVETSLEWIQLCRREPPRHEVVHLESNTHRALEGRRPFDLIFSDGIGVERLACTQAALKMAPIVIEHDTEVWTAEDLERRRSSNHVMLRYDVQNPETTVWIATSLNAHPLLNIGCRVI